MSRAAGWLAMVVAGGGLVAGSNGWASDQRAAGPSQPRPSPAPLAAAFEAELARIGEFSVEQFAERFSPAGPYLEKLTFDPTTAAYFKEFQRRFNINGSQEARLRRNGFLAADCQMKSFAQVYYQVFSSDAPVYVTADSVLHAWHRSFDAMLEETEEQVLAPRLDSIFKAMAERLPAARRAYGRGILADSLTDADYFLCVGRSLLAGKNLESSGLGQNDRVGATLDQIRQLRPVTTQLFGQRREWDGSQFKPRGHYDKTPASSRYFQSMTWCGRADLRIGGNPQMASNRELGAAVVLHDLLRGSGMWEEWADSDRYLALVFGRADSLTFTQLDSLLERAGIHSPTDLKTPEDLARLQARIEREGAGAQQIAGDIFMSSGERGKAVLPLSFAFFGQHLALDSWALSKVVFDDVQWNGHKVQRRIPSGLDVAFAVFANNHLTPVLVERFNERAGLPFRDGLPYQHNLAAMRGVIDSLAPADWEGSLYARWLACLRALSQGPSEGIFPEATRTRAWGLRIANTQLGSWSELRHDSVLYVKQSYTRRSECDFPTGYVEPLPQFWARLEAMARWAATSHEPVEVPAAGHPRAERLAVPRNPLRDRHVEFLTRFATRVAVLRQIAEHQADGEELNDDQKLFLKQVVTQIRRDRTMESGGGPVYSGWYFDLFYRSREDGDKRAALVADVHTDVPDPLVGDPGCVLHAAVGDVDVLVVAIDRGKERFVCAGPIFSHYEFTGSISDRLTDSQWQALQDSQQAPPRPEWTREYFAP